VLGVLVIVWANYSPFCDFNSSWFSLAIFFCAVNQRYLHCFAVRAGNWAATCDQYSSAMLLFTFIPLLVCEDSKDEISDIRAISSSGDHSPLTLPGSNLSHHRCLHCTQLGSGTIAAIYFRFLAPPTLATASRSDWS
jgi:hypothetical protein